MRNVLAMPEFDDGNRFADFDPGTDNVAAYGIAALVGGALADKTSLLAARFAMLPAAEKVIGLAGAGAAIGHVFKRGKT
jgi:uncharacterized membrane-anchored protein